jgi:hypothetical protein
MKRLPGELKDRDRVSIDDVITEREVLRRTVADLLKERAEIDCAAMQVVQLLSDERRDHQVTRLIGEAQRNRIRALRSVVATLVALLACVAAVLGVEVWLEPTSTRWALFFVASYGTAAGGFLFFKSRFPHTAIDAR